MTQHATIRSNHTNHLRFPTLHLLKDQGVGMGVQAPTFPAPANFRKRMGEEKKKDENTRNRRIACQHAFQKGQRIYKANELREEVDLFGDHFPAHLTI